MSQQTRRRQRLRDWIENVGHEALRAHPRGEPALTRAVEVRITFLFNSTLLDIDNLAKPVLDALKGIAFRDDEQVTDLLLRKRNLDRGMRIVGASSILAAGMDLGLEFVHVVVLDAPDQDRLP